MQELEKGYFICDDPAFPLGADAVQLAHFAVSRLPERASQVCDLGCGAGAVLLLMAAGRSDVTYTGVELRAGAAALAEKALRDCRAAGLPLEGRILTADLRTLPRTGLAEPGSMDMVVCNPPYYPVGAGKPPADQDAAIARTELTLTPGELCRSAAGLLRQRGSLCIVIPPARLPDYFAACADHGLRPRTLTFAAHRPDAAPSMALLEAVRGGRQALQVSAPVILT